jgi:magnesium-transporting ATPase (P-type)
LIDFKKANIKTWMLTGDKGETARMIGLLCGMLSCGGTYNSDADKSTMFI